MESNEFKNLVEKYKQELLKTYNINGSSLNGESTDRFEQTKGSEVQSTQMNESTQDIVENNSNAIDNNKQQDNESPDAIDKLPTQPSSQKTEIIDDNDLNALNQSTNNQNTSTDSNDNDTFSDQVLFLGKTSTNDESYAEFLNNNRKNGILKVQTSIARQTRPIENVTVIISKDFKDGKKIFYNLKTDQNGIIDNLLLPAPPKDLSMHPSQTLPFATYDIFVSHPNFQESRFLNIPIFEGIKSIQPINLLPL